MARVADWGIVGILLH